MTDSAADRPLDTASDRGAEASTDSAPTPDAPGDTGLADGGADASADGPPLTDTGTPTDTGTVDSASVDSAPPAPDASPSDGGMDAAVDAPADGPPATDGELTMPGPWMPLGAGMCRPEERQIPVQVSPHVETDASVVYLSNPPSSGPHFGSWARWGAFRDIARGNWVHNLEHGGLAFLYRCPTGTCDATRDALAAAAAAIPTDPACMPTDAEPTRVRVVITNDNVIETPIAAAAWGWVYRANCVDAESLRVFYTRHAGMAPENFCADGFVP